MHKEDIDVSTASKLISQHVDFVTCFHCCKYYIAPETAPCGHTCCHLCWSGQRTCPRCGVSVNKRSLTLNMPMKIMTEHVQNMVEPFEQMCGMKLEEIGLNIQTLNKRDQIKNPRNVSEWLASSQNHFSAPPINETQKSLPDIMSPVELTASKIQIHEEPKKGKSLPKVVHVPPPQDDWDVIQSAQDTEDMVKDKQNIVGPMDLEPFDIDYDKEYTNKHPRRSSRKKDTSLNVSDKKEVTDKNSSNNSENERKLDKAKQNWTNVKKMKKEFGKLGKNNRSKLNVSIEMCKRTQSARSKQLHTAIEEKIKEPNPGSGTSNVIIEDTPEIDNNKPVNVQNVPEENVIVNNSEDIEMIENTNEIMINDQSKQVVNTGTKKETSKRPLDKLPKVNKIKNTPNSDTFTTAKEEQLKKIPFVKKSSLQNEKEDPIEIIKPSDEDESNVIIVKHDDNNTGEEGSNNTSADDDIHITIRIGTVVTNITINKKRDVKLKVNSDQEVQTSLGQAGATRVNTASAEKVNEVDDDVNIKKIATKDAFTQSISAKDTNKSVSTKKHTASAETATAQYEITNSVEKELSKGMECDVDIEMLETPPISSKINPSSHSVKNTNKISANSQVDEQNDNDVIEKELSGLDEDIFNSGSVKEFSAKTHKTLSEILVPTNRTRVKTQKSTDKRNREDNNDDDMPNKKRKCTEPVIDNTDVIPETDQNKSDHIEMCSEDKNYTGILSQVFANIDADIRETESNKNVASKTDITQTLRRKNIENAVDVAPKDSESMFSTIGNIEHLRDNVAGPETQKNIDNLLTPGMCRDLGAVNTPRVDDVHIGTPNHDDDSDKSVVEETPQKNKSRLSSKAGSGNKTVISNKKLQLKSKPDINPREPSKEVEEIINLTDSITEKDNETIKLKTLETPLTINRFLDDIKHKSTPFARKSLNFTGNTNEIEGNATLCPSPNILANNTQEKAIMSEVFANKESPVRRPLAAVNVVDQPPKKFCIAGSCLASNTETVNIKILCFKRKWVFTNTYTSDLTHLVVGVDEDNKAQRSVKYMCAVAEGKWIVSYKWIAKCLETGKVVNEEPYEVLDSSGEPGPRKSRLSTQKLFKGLKFYCMPPFSVLDVDTLKTMLEAAGGTVVGEASAVRVREGDAPALLLAEPATTQEDRFIYMAMESVVVPVNYEWALNSLAEYSLCSIMELLLCPASLLPSPTTLWPQELMATDDSV